MKLWTLVLFLFAFSFLSYSQEKADKEATFEEEEQKLIDYSSIKNVLKNDGLIKQKKKREQFVEQIKVERKNISRGKYSYPGANDFWPFMTELWLVKNAQKLSWDFPKPEYGIAIAFKNLLEKLGYYNKTFKVLMINSPNVVHFGLPGGKDEYIFLLSLPFVRSLDLTKVDISLLLLEDFFRIESGDFIKNLNYDLSFLGTNFYGQKDFMKHTTEVLKRYGQVIYKEGFNFQQQFETTKMMDSVLKSDPALWGAYYRVISKINKFIANDMLYKDYLKIYPSPELQLQWLMPKKRVL